MFIYTNAADSRAIFPLPSFLWKNIKEAVRRKQFIVVGEESY